MKENNRNQGITLLKIIGTFGVVIYHFFQQFVPGIINGNTINCFEYYLSFTPIYAFWNAQFFIALFWGISGFLLGYNTTYKYSNIRIISIILKNIKRYLKFFFPFVITTVVSFTLTRYKLYSSLYIEGTGFNGIFRFTPKLTEAIYEGIIGCFVSNKARYNPVLWTMTIEYFEYFILSVIIVFIKQLNWRRKNINIILICVFILSFRRSIYMPMIVGFIGGYNYTNGMIQNKRIKYLCLLLSIFFAGYPYMHSKAGMYKIIPSISGWIYYSIGCIFLIPYCFSLDNIQKEGSIRKKIFNSLGGGIV